MIKHISVSTLTDYIGLGVVTSVYLLPTLMTEKWTLWVSCKNGEERLLVTARGEERHFSSLNTAVDLLKQVGWRRPVTLHLD